MKGGLNVKMIDINWIIQQFPELTNLSPLGHGGQKEVFSAFHPSDGDVVLKLFHINADRERALREVSVDLYLKGALIPKTLEIGTSHSPVGELIWLREERIKGESLRNVLSRSLLSNQQLLCLGKNVLETLTIAEKEQIVHRDVKPDNVIFANNGFFWLIDFGFARHLNLDSLTATALPFGVGTPGYAPPEQFRNLKDNIDSRADLFGLGVTLYESTEGTNPLREGARSNLEMLHRTETQPLPRIARQVDKKNEFADLIFSMTRIQRDHRPLSVEEALIWMREICSFEGL